MYTISKQFHFSASHCLVGVPPDHPCARLHGHNYVVELELRSKQLNAAGFVRDYLELRELKLYLEEQLDHRHINDVLGDEYASAERLAHWLFDWCAERWPETCAVRVSETPKTWAEYRPA